MDITCLPYAHLVNVVLWALLVMGLAIWACRLVGGAS